MLGFAVLSTEDGFGPRQVVAAQPGSDGCRKLSGVQRALQTKQGGAGQRRRDPTPGVPFSPAKRPQCLPLWHGAIDLPWEVVDPSIWQHLKQPVGKQI